MGGRILELVDTILLISRMRYLKFEDHKTPRKLRLLLLYLVTHTHVSEVNQKPATHASRSYVVWLVFFESIDGPCRKLKSDVDIQ